MTTLIVFARAPVEGQVKTRLARSIGAGPACTLYRAFLEDVCALAGSFDTRRILAVDRDHPELTRLAEGHGMELVAQVDGDLGARMQAALNPVLPACVIGSDAPTLPRKDLQMALERVQDWDALLGPSVDGGYWLLGISRPLPELFSDLPWSTPDLLMRTLDRLRGRRSALLSYHFDIDEEKDLQLLTKHLGLLGPEVAPATRRALAQLGL